ncbi:MAG: radical SAM protein [Deltaproteobacteria bacterium]|nr:radical SAM protein [Deltaproteobacteria bacterium]
MSEATLINIHAVLKTSSVNGPGLRMVVFFQGCSRNCPGCFNPQTHPLDAKTLMTPAEIFNEYYAGGVEGITVSGGEPFSQPAGLERLLESSRARGLSTVVYTGFTHEELLKMPEASVALTFTDALIDGPFEIEKTEKTLLARGSTNQRTIFLTGRYAEADFYMPGKIELIIGKNGIVTGTGFGGIAPFGNIAFHNTP